MDQGFFKLSLFKQEVVSVVGGGLISSMNISCLSLFCRKFVLRFRMVMSYGFVESLVGYDIIMNKLVFFEKIGRAHV